MTGPLDGGRALLEEAAAELAGDPETGRRFRWAVWQYPEGLRIVGQPQPPLLYGDPDEYVIQPDVAAARAEVQARGDHFRRRPAVTAPGATG